MINDLQFFSGTNNVNYNEMDQEFEHREQENVIKRTNFIRSARQNKVQTQATSGGGEIGEVSEAINYRDQNIDSIKQQLFGQQQLRQIQSQQQQKQYSQSKQQNYQQSQTTQQNLASPKFLGRCKSETKTSKSIHYNAQIPHPQLNTTQSKSNLKSSSSYLNIFSSRQNQQTLQQQQQQDQRQQQLSCITPEKLTEKILDMGSTESHREQRNLSLSPNKYGGESPIFQNKTLKQKGTSCERNSLSNLSYKEQTQRLQYIEQPAQNIGLLTFEKSEAAISECVEHKEPYSLFCETDKKLCCVNCIYKGSGHHKNHNVIPLKQSFNLLKQELSNFKSKQKDKLHQIDEAIRIQTMNKQQILKTFFSYKELVNKEFEKLIQAIQQRQSVVVEEINSVFSQKLMDAEENLRLLSDIRIEFKNFKEFENQSKNGNFLQSVKVYAVKQQLNKSLKTFDAISIIENTKEELNQFDFQNKHSLMLEINQLGRIKNNSSAKNQPPKQIAQKSSNAYFSSIKQSISPNNAIRTTLRIDGDQLNQSDNTEQSQPPQRNLDLKLSLRAAGVRASLETPSGQNSITSRQRYPSNQQKPISPQSSNIQKIQPSSQFTQNSILPAFNQKQNNITPPQMDQMNIFVAEQFMNQNTIQTERQSCSSQASKKSFMFNDKPPLNVVKKQGQSHNNRSEINDINHLQAQSPYPLQNIIQQNLESEQKQKLNKGYNSSSHQGLFLSNDGQFLNPPLQNFSSKVNPITGGVQSETSSQNQVLFQTQSGSYSTKKTQYSSISQNGAGKFSSLSAQIKQITQNIPDNLEIDEYDVTCQDENDKENAFQEPEEQMVYLNSVSSRKEHHHHSQPQTQTMKQSNSSQNLGTLNQEKIQQAQQKKMSYLSQKNKDFSNQSKKPKQQLNENAVKENRIVQNTNQSKVFEDKTSFIINQTQQNTTNLNASSNSFILNTSQISNNQGEMCRNTSLYSVTKNNNLLNSSNQGNTTTRRSNGNKLMNNESLETSNEGNQELIKQLNQEILYENFVQDRDEKSISMSGMLIESMSLKEKERDQITQRSNNTQLSSIKTQPLQITTPPNAVPIYFNESRILDNENREQLVSLLPFKCKSTSLLYSMKEDKMSSDSFHEKCDGRGPYLILVKANSFIFGYYSPISFVKCDKYITCSNSFIFSLNNIYNSPPTIFPVKQDKKFIALYQSIKNPCLGSTLQNKQDLWINFDDPRNSFSCLGYAYKIEGQFDGNKILAGQYTDWNVQAIEVYNVIS